MEEGRRARARRRTEAELQAAALAEIREHGAVALSLRRVARRVGMSPAGLYRYVDSREDLLTRLIAGAYGDLADCLLVATGQEPHPDRADEPVRPPTVTAVDADPADRLRAVALAYRHWGVSRPQEFGLLFGDPIPGYAAPPGGVTVAAMGRVGDALGRPLVDAAAAGRVRRLPADRVPEALAAALAPMGQVAGRALEPWLAATLLLAWGRLHGQVSLEVFGHHAWLFPDGCELLYRAEVETLLRDLGVTG